MIASVRCCDVVLASRLDPLDGFSELLCDDAADYLFGVEVELASESAADIGSDDADFVFGMSCN